MIQKTVFLSYRRNVSLYVARSIFQDLHHNGYDVFIDIEGIGSGQFENIILHQISARAHFLVILEEKVLDEIDREGDWLRKEIEHAIKTKRNIVPIMLDNYSIEKAKPRLSGKLSSLLDYNFLFLHDDYFSEGMAKLRAKFLNQSVDIAVVPTPTEEKRIVDQKIQDLKRIADPTKIAYVDSIGKIEDAANPTVFSLRNGKPYSIIISGENKAKLLKEIGILRPKRSQFNHRRFLYTLLLFNLLKERIKKLNRVEIDEEYQGHSASIKEHLINLIGLRTYQNCEILFTNLHKTSPAFSTAAMIYKNRAAYDKEIVNLDNF